ncbi:insulinase family protein [Plantactinospora sp. B5E13]|uniref:M16 family metallopeptidase n=1 Tax=unclassified Plantactinospora TaxID=2631981 RepID=UPI00325D9E55
MIQFEVDGVPGLFVEATGPLRAGLMFRVGRADESLPLAGVTHLVEHLALHRHGLLEHHANADVTDAITHFYTTGTDAEVATFFHTLCSSLADLPLERLEVEKEILRTEAAGRARGVNADLPLWRYGAQGYGQVSYPEFGLHRLTADDLRDWVAAHFTRDNAVLWVTGAAVPPALRLSLPAGTRRPGPAPSSALETTPAYFQVPADGVVMDSVVNQNVASRLFAAVLERALYRNLRLEAGVSYAAVTDYSPRADGMAVLTAYVDALPEKKRAALTGFVDTVKQLATAAIDEAELESVRAKALEALAHPDFETGRLPGVAVDLLTGQPLFTTGQLAEQLRAVTVADVLAVAEAAHASALLLVPYGVSAYGTGFTAAPSASLSAVAGKRYRSRDDTESTLVVGPDGVSTISETGKIATVRFTDCAARLCWPDGGSVFIGRDGITVAVEPTLHRIDDAALADLTSNVPDTLVVPLPKRDPDQIPRPRRSPDETPRPEASSTPARKREFMILAPLTAVLGWGFISMANAWTPEDGELAENLLLLMLVLVTIGLVRVILVGIRRLGSGHW